MARPVFTALQTSRCCRRDSTWVTIVRSV